MINVQSPIETELLLFANPLHGNKKFQKGALGTCSYYALNYIRDRYKYAKSRDEERKIEKNWSENRRKSMILNFCHIVASHGVDEILKEIKDDSNFIEMIDILKQRLKMTIKKFLNNYAPRFDLQKEIRIYLDGFEIYLKKFSNETKFKKNMEQYYFKKFADLQIYFLTKIINVNLDELIKDFFIQRGFRPRPLNSNSIEFGYTLLPCIYHEQQIKSYQLQFSTWNPRKNNLTSLIKELESKGPHVFIMNGNIVEHINKKFIKKKNGFNIYEVTFNEKPAFFSHTITVVGGGENNKNQKFIYYIDPNDSYSDKSKVPIYKISYDLFFNNVRAQEKGLQIHHSIDDDADACCEKYYGVFGANGLKPTRDP